MVLEIWVDSDSVPKNLRLILLRLGLRLNCPTFFVADRSLPDVVSFIKEHTTQLRKNAKEEGQTDPFILKQIK